MDILAGRSGQSLGVKSATTYKRNLVHTSQGFRRDHDFYNVFLDITEKHAYEQHFYRVAIHGKSLLLTKNSCSIFRDDVPFFSQIRFGAIWLTEWSKFDKVVLVVIGLNCAALAVPQSYDNSYEKSWITDGLDAFNIFSTLFFCGELLAKIVARGFFFGDAPDPPYLREMINWLDFIVVVTGILELALVGGLSSEMEQVVVFRALRVLRGLRTMKVLPHLRLIVTALQESTSRLFAWAVFSMIIFLIFACVGMQLFGSVYWQRCRLTSTPVLDSNSTLTWPIDPEQSRFCGGWYDCVPTTAGAPTYCGSPLKWEFTKDGQTVAYDIWADVEDQPESDYGFTGFQTLGASLMTVFTCCTMEGWSTLMYKFQDGRGGISTVYFGGLVLFGGLLLMNFVLAIVWERFDNTSKSAEYLIVRKKVKIPEAIMSLRLHELVAEVTVLEAEREQNKIFKQLDTADRGLGLKNICYSICTNPRWMSFMDGVIILNAGVLACDQHPPMDTTAIEIFERINMMCTFTFMVEVVFKMLGNGVNFFGDHFNVFDLVLVLVSFVEMLGLEGENAVSALRTARLLRLFKMMKMQMSIRVLLRVLQRALVPMYNFTVVASLCLYCFALLCLQMMYSLDPGDGSELSFHDIGWSCISGFTLLTTESWFSNMVAFARISKQPFIVTSLFVSGLILMHFVLMNLLLGIFAVSFAQARDELLEDYRVRLLDFRVGPQEEIAMVTDNFSKEKLEEEEEDRPPSPRWPEEAMPPQDEQTSAKHMTLFKMMQIKRVAAIRKTIKGENLMWDPTAYYNKHFHPAGIFQIEKTQLSEQDEKQVASMLAKSAAAAAALEPVRSMEADHAAAFATAAERAAPPEESGEATERSQRKVNFDTNVSGQTDEAAEDAAQPMLVNGAVHCSAPPDFQPTFPAPAIYGAALDVEALLPRPVRRTADPNHFAAPPIVEASESDSVPSSVLAPLRLDRLNLCGEARRTLRRRTCTETKPSTDRQPVVDFKSVYARAMASCENKSEEAQDAKSLPTCKLASRFLPASATMSSSSASSQHVQETAPRPPVPQLNLSGSLGRPQWEECFASRIERAIEQPTSHLRSSPTSEESEVLDVEISVRGSAQRVCEPVAEHYMAPGRGMENASRTLSSPALTTSNTAQYEAMAWQIVSSRWFEPSSFVLITISTICLALENPLADPNSDFARIMGIVDGVVTFAFTTEMVIKILAIGAWHSWDTAPKNSQPYFRSGWNWIDATAVVSGVLDLLFLFTDSSGGPLRLLRSVRLVRVLRPLRLIDRNKTMKLMVEALISAIPTLLNMCVICALFYFGFGILFVNTLKGALHHCTLDPLGKNRLDIVNKDDCLYNGGEWVNSPSNFDHIGNSLMTLLHVGCGEGWIEVMLLASNSVGIDMQPRVGSNLQLALLVICFVAMTNFFLLNLFIGVLVDQYMVTKANGSGMDVMTTDDRRWAQLQRYLLRPSRFSPDRKDGGVALRNIMSFDRRSFRSCSKTILTSRPFEAIVSFAVLCNALVVCQLTPTQTDDMRKYLTVASLFFCSLFAFEIMVKLIVFKKAFFDHSWNVYDFVIVVGSVLSILCDLIPGVRDSAFASLMWFFRVARTFRLVTTHTFLQVLARVLWDLLLGLANCTGLLGLFIFTYACLGMGLFGTLKEGEHLNDHANFQSFIGSMMTLARCATGEQWQKIMYDVVTDQPGCTTEEQSYDDLMRDGPLGCGNLMGYPFFITFVVGVAIVLMNLIVAVILDGFVCVQDMDALREIKRQFEEFYLMFEDVDKTRRGFIEVKDLVQLLSHLPEPVGLGDHGGTEMSVFDLITLPFYEVPGCELQVHIREVAPLLAKRCKLFISNMYKSEHPAVRFHPEVMAEWYSGFHWLPNFGRLTVAHMFVAKKLARAYNIKRERLRLEELNRPPKKDLVFEDDDQSPDFIVIGEEHGTEKENHYREARRDRMQKQIQRQLHQVEQDLPYLKRPTTPLMWPPRELF